MPAWAKCYIACTNLAAAAILSWALAHWQAGHIVSFGLYAALAAAASFADAALPGAFVLTGIIVLDLPQALIVGVICSLSQCLAVAKPRTWRLLFNLPNAVLVVACCYTIYHAPWLPDFYGSTVVRLLAASLAYLVGNSFMIAAIVRLTKGERSRPSWRATLPYLWSTAAAGLIQLGTESIGWQRMLPVAAIVSLIYISYRVYLRRLQDEKNHVARMSDLHLRIIEALAVAIEAKDEAVHHHLQRVQAFAVEVGRELGASEDEIHALRAAALLHDVGNLAVPGYILSKPGHLTPEEFDKIKVHPAVGAEILRRVQFPYPVVPIVAAHHEKWDGSGYPAGLSGDDIPLGARILSAVDCLDSLASDREYRRAVPLEAAMQYLVSQSGRSFDPRVVKVLERCYRDLEELAHGAPQPDSKPPADTPGTGFEELQNTAEEGAPNFTFAIAAARQEFQVLHEVASELGNSLSMEATLSLLGSRLRSIVPHDTIAIYVRHERHLVPQYVHGKNACLFTSRGVAMGQGLSGWVAENRKPIVNGNPEVEPGCIDGGPNAGELRSAISVPLLGVSGVIGVITLYHTTSNAFTKDHLRLLLAVSSKAALTIENALTHREVQKSAITDELTGLPNMRSLFLHLDSEVARCRRTSTPMAVLVTDLDGFKAVNDRFGHLAGNRVLKLVAQGLQAACREYDYVARMGGDEFVLVLPGMQANAVKRKCAELKAMVVGVGRECTGEEILALSVGEAFFPAEATDAEELLAEADRRMYRMKHSRRAGRTRQTPISPQPELPETPWPSPSGTDQDLCRSAGD